MIEEKYLYAKRKQFSKNRKFDRAYLESFKNALVSGGFEEITFKLPHNLLKHKEKDEISFEDFLKRERNYPSVVLVAKNPQTNEVIKALYVNISTKAFFKDDTFPSGHSEPAEFYVLAKPERLHSIFGFYYERFFMDPAPFKTTAQSLAGIASLFIILLYAASIFTDKPGYFTRIYGSSLLDYVTVAVCVALLFLFFNHQTGLYVKEKEFRPAVWLMRAFKGEFRDNPLVNLLLVLIGGLLVLYIGHILNWN